MRAFTDKAASEQRAAEIERDVARKKVALVDRFEPHRKTPLAQHAADYETYLRSKGTGEKQVRLAASRIKATLDGCSFRLLQDIAPALVNWLASQRGDKHRLMSAQTSNHTSPACRASPAGSPALERVPAWTPSRT